MLRNDESFIPTIVSSSIYPIRAHEFQKRKNIPPCQRICICTTKLLKLVACTYVTTGSQLICCSTGTCEDNLWGPVLRHMTYLVIFIEQISHYYTVWGIHCCNRRSSYYWFYVFQSFLAVAQVNMIFLENYSKYLPMQPVLREERRFMPRPSARKPSF